LRFSEIVFLCVILEYGSLLEPARIDGSIPHRVNYPILRRERTGRNGNSVLAGGYPVRTESEAALQEKAEAVRRGKPFGQPSKERPAFEQSLEEHAGESRLNRTGPVC